MNLISMKQVKVITGKSRSTIWRWIRAGTFPKPRQVGTRDIGWLQSEVEEWVETLPMSPTYLKAMGAEQGSEGETNHEQQEKY